MSDFIATAISIAYGPRCPETVEGCPCCEAWAQYDALTASRAQSVTDEIVRPLRELVNLVADDVMSSDTTDDPDEDSVGWNADGELPMTFGHVRRAMNAVLALEAAQRPALPVVKSLEWEELTSPREDGPPEPTGDIEAQTLIGEYSVCFDDDEGVSATPWCVWSPVENIGHFADFDDAKAAAQADYEAKILSALEGEGHE